jgi:hypothetical protein
VKGNILGIFFTVLSGVLIFLIVFAYTRSDRLEPEFRFSATDTIYDSKTTDVDLKLGVAAYDSKDGDLTDRIVVEKVVLNREKETAVVYYAVADYSGNVTKQSRVFPADIADIDNSGEIPEAVQDEGLFPGMFTSEEEVTVQEVEQSAESTQETTANGN